MLGQTNDYFDVTLSRVCFFVSATTPLMCDFWEGQKHAGWSLPEDPHPSILQGKKSPILNLLIIFMLKMIHKVKF